MNDYMKKRYHVRRKALIEQLGGICSKCGSKSNLQFDHIDHKTKDFDIADKLVSTSLEIIRKEIEKCQLLCKKCHIEKTIYDKRHKPWQHGTITGYDHCRCELCKKAKSDYGREYKKRRKNLKA